MSDISPSGYLQQSPQVSSAEYKTIDALYHQEGDTSSSQDQRLIAQLKSSSDILPEMLGQALGSQTYSKQAVQDMIWSLDQDPNTRAGTKSNAGWNDAQEIFESIIRSQDDSKLASQDKAGLLQWGMQSNPTLMENLGQDDADAGHLQVAVNAKQLTAGDLRALQSLSTSTGDSTSAADQTAIAELLGSSSELGSKIGALLSAGPLSAQSIHDIYSALDDNGLIKDGKSDGSSLDWVAQAAQRVQSDPSAPTADKAALLKQAQADDPFFFAEHGLVEPSTSQTVQSPGELPNTSASTLLADQV